MQKRADFVDLTSIDSFESLVRELKELEQSLTRLGHHQFVVFNTAYLLITIAIEKASHEHYFEHPEFIEKFTVAFAHHYFRAINQTLSDDPKLPAAWRLLSEADTNRNLPNAALLLMGANAHINRDLPRVLAELITESDAKRLFADVLKVDKLLVKSGRAIIPAFRERSAVQNWLKDHLIWLYHRPVMWWVLYWRIRAWQDSRSIIRYGLEGNRYANRSVRIAKRLRFVGALFR